MSKGHNKAAHLLDLAGRNRLRPFEIDIIADAALCADLAERLGIRQLQDLRLQGRAEAKGRHEWVLHAALTGRAEQGCVVSDAPVWTDVSQAIRREYRDDLPVPGAGEAEMPEDIDVEPMPERLNLIDLIAEEIALALPDYPRAADQPFVEERVAPKEAEPAEKENPFKVLQKLQGLGKGDEET